MRRSLYWLTVLLVVAGSAMAKEHPVPLDSKTDAAKCVECHQDKTQGKHVHSAMAMGCTTCHEVRTYRNITRVKLIDPLPAKLCIKCHTDKDATQIKGKVHPPAVRDCLKCHDPHSSDHKDQLLKPVSGATKQDNLCLQCHDIGLNTPAGGSRHPALDMGCNTCHVIHKSGNPSKVEFRYHLTKDAPALCLDCHDVTDADLIKAHQGQPFAKANCLTCHDPHQSRYPHLLQKYLHPPFEAGACDTCHQPSKDGKVVLTAATAKDVCVTCHSDIAEKIAKAKVQHPGAQGDCTDCHSPHGGSTPYFLQPDPVSACLACHTDKADMAKADMVLHQPAFEQGCGICHTPHGGDNDHLLRAKSPNALCLECHGPNAHPQQLKDEHLVTIFDGKVKLPENYFQKVPVLPLKYDMGHPVQDHPVSDFMNPKTKTMVSMNCLSCHQPHAGKQQGMLVNDQRDNTAFCRTCHINPLNLTDVRVGGK